MSLTPPVVSNADRDWSLAQCPVWAVRGAVIAPDSEPPAKALVWDRFVAGQIERFEKFFADQRKASSDWSRLWRQSWWPKADPALTHPHLVPYRKTPIRVGSATLVPPLPALRVKAGDPSWTEWLDAIEAGGSEAMRQTAEDAGEITAVARWPTPRTPLPKIASRPVRGKQHAAGEN